MELLFTFDDKNYNDSDEISLRTAVRAIIFDNDKLAMVYSQTEGYYKFPGGGIEKNESEIDALIRETKEEVGLEVIPTSIKEFGMIFEKRKSDYKENVIFEHYSKYYIAEVTNNKFEQKLDLYEADERYKLVYIDIKKAYEINMELGKKYYSKYILREAKVLELLLKERAIS